MSLSQNFLVPEIVIASIYMASKVIEKKGLSCKLIEKDTFRTLLKAVECVNE